MTGRKRLRIPGADYANPGVTFVTICLEPRLPLLGRVVGDQVALSTRGEIVDRELSAVGSRVENVEIGERMVMPDHLHALFIVRETPATPIPAVVRVFKSVTAHAVRDHRGRWKSFWQRSFYDHLVRDQEDLDRCREYIASNPRRWTEARRASNDPHPGAYVGGGKPLPYTAADSDREM